MAIVSEGPVASVAMFTTKPIQDIRTIAADTSSRTSNALLRVLCRERFAIDPEFIPMAPRPIDMLRRCDAALVIGDAALFFDHQAARRREGRSRGALDGDERPAVRVGVLGGPSRRRLTTEHLEQLIQARDAGVAAADAIAAAYCGPGREEIGKRYLRENIRYDWGPRELEGLRAFYELAFRNGLVQRAGTPVFYRREP